MTSNIDNLIQQADQVKENAYCPYSHFKVGAAILTDKNNIYSGCNIESSAFGATLCAEGAAIANMVSSGEKYIKDIVVTSSSDTECYPCGICLQKISEFSDNNTQIHICVNNKIIHSYKMNQLLPHGFNENIFLK